MADVHVKPILGWLRNIFNQYSLFHNYCGLARNQSSYPRRPTWNGLPDVAVRKIFGQLQTGDRSRLMVVSKSWKRILCRDDLPIAPEIWCLSSSSSFKKKNITLLSISEGYRKYSFKVPEFRSGGVWLCGSSSGWIIVASGHKFDPDFFLWNPLTDVVMTLPRLSTAFPCLPQALESGPKEYIISSYIKRGVVFSQECIVAVVLSKPCGDGLQDFLLICTPKDRKWMVFEHQFHTLSDILFHDEKLYVLAKHAENGKDKKFTKKICLSNCQVQVCMMCLDYKGVDVVLGDGNNEQHQVENNPLFNMIRGDKISEHLVELSGQLLVIVVVFDLFAYNSNGDGPIRRFSRHQIQRMEVRKVNGMEKVENLGNKRVMLADIGSLSVPPSAAGEFDTSIFYTTQYARGTVGNDDWFVYEQGTFDLDTSEIRRHRLEYYEYPRKLVRGWHTPKLF